jgi:hypothetical protein
MGDESAKKATDFAGIHAETFHHQPASKAIARYKLHDLKRT